MTTAARNGHDTTPERILFVVFELTLILDLERLGCR
jgi:hypothetical protein